MSEEKINGHEEQDQKKAVLVILVSHDEGETWAAVPTKDVPEWLKAPEIIGRIMHGEIAQEKGRVLSAASRPWYRAEAVHVAGVGEMKLQ